jgi:hypothetical protein
VCIPPFLRHVLGAVRFDDIRHTCAAILIARGGPGRDGHVFPTLDATLTDRPEEPFQESVRERRDRSEPAGRSPQDAAWRPEA